MPEVEAPEVLVQVDTTPLGVQIDELFELREKKRAAEAVVDEIQSLINAKEFALMTRLEDQGLDRASGKKATVGISETVVPQVENWDAFYQYIRRHNAFELLERRAAAAAWREHAQGRRDHTVPGTVPFTKRKLNLRTI